jgi:formamidopyrimidine-DNA glycosylase
MPELPEIEALTRALEPHVTVSPVAGPPIAHFAVLKTFAPPLKGMQGIMISRVRRRAKTMLFELADGTTLAIHLMSAGRLAWLAPDAKRVARPMLLVPFEDGSALQATEGGTKKRMRIGLYDPAGLDELLRGLGPEPLEETFTLDVLSGILDTANRQLHPLLRDQRAIAGIGRAFANEILWTARLSPFAISGRLDEESRIQLHDAIRSVLANAVSVCVELQGPALPQRNDKRPLAIHGKDGQPCPRCFTTLQFVDFEEHRIVYCPTCQTGGRLLADRRLSRLLK